MSLTVRFSARAIEDLGEIFDYLLPRAGEKTARAHVSQLPAYCLGLEQFPERGRIRDDLRPGLRLIGFKRQATIAFAVRDGSLTILRVFGRGRDVESGVGVSGM